MWFRRDLRLGDSPALREAVATGSDGVVPLFVVDPALWGPAGAARRAYLRESLARLSEQVGGLQLRHGDPVEQVVSVARAAGANTVHISSDFGPYGRERDSRVQAGLGEHGIRLERTGSPYAVAPGRVAKPDGTAYRVYTPFARAWAGHGWRPPVPAPGKVPWIRPSDDHGLPDAPVPVGASLPQAGEAAALQRWRTYVETTLTRYDEVRNRPDLNLTSRMSVHLKWGEIHPRTMLADAARAAGEAGPSTYRSELAWREFYADVVWRHPESTRDYLQPQLAGMAYDAPGVALDAWREGRTGYPIVDAGMRQLLHEGWMHNRVRMIVASFLVKDLHVEWQHGARHFMRHLVDADLASNAHGWQWVAGSGTDAAPYFRIFNPVTQGLRFDPEGAYVRRHVPELRGVAGPLAQEPWRLPGGLPDGYPPRIVDHAHERREALSRYEATR
jgi:deoxyribodipyrimidine photo-lyase